MLGLEIDVARPSRELASRASASRVATVPSICAGNHPGTVPARRRIVAHRLLRSSSRVKMAIKAPSPLTHALGRRTAWSLFGEQACRLGTRCAWSVTQTSLLRLDVEWASHFDAPI
jgi:hypothetical protein